MIATETPDDPLEGFAGPVRALIARGLQKGFLTYAEMHCDLREELLPPEMIDRILIALEIAGIELVDDNEADRGCVPPA
jgi:hypothetical protein